MKKIALLTICIIAAVSSFANNVPDIKSAKTDKSKSFITYHMSHPLHSWSGTSKEVDGAIQYDEKNFHITKVTIIVKVSTFDSKNSGRDSRMVEVTEASKYPAVTMESSSIVYKGSVLEINGMLTFHGVSKPVNFIANEQPSAKNRKIITGNFSVLLEDFKIKRPSMIMMKTDNEIKMDFSVEFNLD